MEFVGDCDPDDGADGGEWRRLGEVVDGGLHEIVEGCIDGKTLGNKGAGEDKQIDKKEEPDQQRDRTPLVRLDVAIKSVGGHGLTRHSPSSCLALCQASTSSFISRRGWPGQARP